ncbi:MAG TPA: FliH/SctL family protein [Pirellulales bacterium]|jgi:flagellar assembly protein FliH|nr:FliH/SctL family protein [Pirellulales bacterium]
MATITSLSQRGRVLSAAERAALSATDPSIDAAQQQAAAILEQARREAEEIRRLAAEDGYRQATALAEATIAERVQPVVAALREAAKTIEQARSACITRWEQQAVHVACAIAERIVRRELRQSPDIPLGLVREALELAAASDHLRLVLHPTDCKALGNEIDHLVAEFARHGAIEIATDAKVGRGGCLVETRYGMIDQRIASQLARIEEELT